MVFGDDLRETPNTVIKTSDGSVKTTEGAVYWILIAVGATGGTWELNDSTDDSGTDLLGGVAIAHSQQLLDFGDSPVVFGTAIYADITGSNIALTVGYT